MSKKMRRQHWVDSRVQGTLVRRILFHWCAFFVVTLMCVSVMHLLLGDPNKTIVERATTPGSSMMLIGVIMLALFPAFALDTIRFSNRFVGPIARLRRYMRELTAGEAINSLAFRDNDFWSEVADEFNAVSDMVREQAKEIESLKQQLADSRHAGV
jgi:signal transduction histidine kinase